MVLFLAFPVLQVCGTVMEAAWVGLETVNVSQAFSRTRETTDTGTYVSAGTPCVASAASHGTSGSSQTGSTARGTPTASQGGAAVAASTTATGGADPR